MSVMRGEKDRQPPGQGFVERFRKDSSPTSRRRPDNPMPADLFQHRIHPPQHHLILAKR
jgi:hypothetical protein